MANSSFLMLLLSRMYAKSMSYTKFVHYCLNESLNAFAQPQTGTRASGIAQKIFVRLGTAKKKGLA